MISVERSFYDRFPALAEGQGRRWSQPVVELLRRVTCEARINEALQGLAGASGHGFVERALDHLGVRYRVAHTDREHIPAEGRLIVVANHPLGAIDALALLHLVGSVRRDVRILANEFLLGLDPLRPRLLPLDVFSAGAGRTGVGLRAAYRALEQEQTLILFPAGEVSRLRPGGVRDRAWSDGFLRMARRSGAPVLPVHIGARNSPAFYGPSLLAKPLATLLLPREMLAAERCRIDLSIGNPVPSAALALESLRPERVAAHMRRHVYRLPRRKPPVFATTCAVAHPEEPLRVRRALEAGECLGETRDGRQIVLLDADHDSPALREIGRLRELSFRRVGEGTGLRRDLDAFDTWYRHIVLWDAEGLEIVGAYRLGEVGRILTARGLGGLYSSSLFEYGAAAQEFLPHALELGRSFVAPRHWGSRSLDYLWQGIGAYLRRHPDVRHLIGPVSLSASLPDEARACIVVYHERYFGDREGLARARNPARFRIEDRRQAEQAFQGLDAAAAAAALRQRLQALGAGLPVLYRQYVDLCEPDGVRFLGFGVDPGFGHCVDGLIRLDLARLRPARRERYLGRGGAVARA